LIDGSVFSDQQLSCYVPVFPFAQSKDEWYIGTLAMQKYYTVYDGRPNEHFGADLRVGIAIASSWY